MILFLLCTTLFASAQQIGRWEKLGQKEVQFRTERDAIRASHKGTFTKLKIHVKGAPVEFHKVIVKYANGSTQELKIRQVIEAGGETRILDLRGNKRVIREVVFYYKTVKTKYDRDNRNDRHYRPGHNGNRRKAVVSVWGRH